MLATTHHDLVVTLADTIGEVAVPDPLRTVPIQRLRLGADGIIDAASHPGPWWVDGAGTKHIAAHDGAWQRVDCAWSDRLVLDGDGWRAETEVERRATNDAAIVEAAHRRIDRLLDRALSPSRVSRYARKLDEAQRFIAAGRPDGVTPADYPILVAEAAARDVTAGELADLIVAAAAAQATLDAQTEAARAAVTRAVATAGDGAGKHAAAGAAVQAVVVAISAAANRS